MNFLDKLREKLGPELAAQVEDAVGDDFNFDVVPRSRLNKVIGQRNALQSKLDAVSINTKGEADDDDDDSAVEPPVPANNKSKSKDKGAEGSDVETLKSQHAKELADVAKRYAVLDKLRAEGARDPKLILSQINLEKVTLKDDDTLEGLDDILTPWKESHSYMFNSEKDDDSTPSGTGRSGQSTDDDADDPFEAVIASYGK